MAKDFSIAGKEDQPIQISVNDILAHASDDDPGDGVKLDSVGSPANGTLTLNGDVYTYQPAANYYGQDFVSYTVLQLETVDQR